MVDRDGRVKVLDFGLAKAMGADGEGSGPELTHSPTLTMRATRAGVLLGTAAYMSPEQARGQVVGPQADIWAFGVVLWEMLTGKPLFVGETLQDVLAGVLSRQVDVAALPPEVPLPIRRALDGCRARDRRGRWRHIGEPFLVAAGGETPSVDGHGNLLYQEPRPHRNELVRVDRAGRVLEVLGEPMVWLFAPHLAPDGKRVAFVATDSQGTDVWVRHLELGTTSRVTFTPEVEFSVRWSAEGDRLAFDVTGAEHMLHVLDLESGGTPTTIGAGARPVWGPGGSLVYEVFGARGIWTAVPEASGDGWTSTLVLDYPTDESSPTLSPDGRFMAFLADPSGQQEVYVTRFPSGQGRWQVSRGASFVDPVWSRRGDEIFYLDDTGMMVAAPVQTSPELIVGAPQPLFEPAGWEEGYWKFDVDRESRRFLLSRPLSDEPRQARIVHVHGWLRELRPQR